MSGNIKKYTKHKGYESINRNMLQDVDNLSLQAIGLLANLTSMPDDWAIYKTELYKRFAKNKKTSVQNAWNELVENKYIVQLRRRNGKKYDYIYYYSQEGFSEEDIKEIQEIENCDIWDGKSSTKASQENNSSTAENQQSKMKRNWSADFQQSKMNSSKPADNKLTIKEIYYKDKELDTKDTRDTEIHAEIDYIKEQEKYFTESFVNNTEKISEKIAKMLHVFSEGSEKKAERYYSIILKAKNAVSENLDTFIWIEDDPEVEQAIIFSFTNAIRKIKRDQIVQNPDGYVYAAILNHITDIISTRNRKLGKSEMQKEFEHEMKVVTEH